MRPTDTRPLVYESLHRQQLLDEEAATRTSAEIVLTEVSRHYMPCSILDVGCGIGIWLEAAARLGITDVAGVEGHWLDTTLLRVDPSRIVQTDLDAGFSLNRRFDLVTCLEVAEHLPETSARTFIESLTRHGDVILFSAAIPFQGGTHHVNEQFLEYWQRHLREFGFEVVDCIRPRIWTNQQVLWWYRQNTVFFVRSRSLAAAYFQRYAGIGLMPLSIVHPDHYVSTARTASLYKDEHAKLLNLLASGKTFAVGRDEGGRLVITRTS